MQDDLTPEQEGQLAAWFAAGRSDDDIHARVEGQNARRIGQSPWPRALDLPVLRQELAAQARDLSRHAQALVIDRGLGDRSRMIVRIAERIEQLERVIDLVVDGVESYAFAGSLTNDVQALVVMQVLEGQVEGGRNNKALQLLRKRLDSMPGSGAPLPPEDAAYAASEVDLSRVWLSELAFSRTVQMLQTLNALYGTQVQQYKLLAQITGASSADAPPNVEARQEKIDRATRRVIELAEKRARAATVLPGFDTPTDELEPEPVAIPARASVLPE